ncbi:hypothetical protein [Enhygromyxa salina]|uniref:hypothetical protein n=1 Tax=Enhygromyxa salina TaxID=215803 RepID=UPI0011B1ED28|nr:hypothetical protein [Enhygromyxa salina]
MYIYIPEGEGAWTPIDGDELGAGEEEYEQRLRDAEDEFNAALNPILRVVDEKLDPYFDKRWDDPGRPPHSEGEFGIALWVLGAVASGLTWDFIKAAGLGLWSVLKKGREAGIAIETDARGLMIVAIMAAKKITPELVTHTSALRCIEDNTEVIPREPGGVCIFSIPDMKNRNTHIIALTLQGEVVFHNIADFISNDAGGFLSSGDEWKWSSDEDWT